MKEATLARIAGQIAVKALNNIKDMEREGLSINDSGVRYDTMIKHFNATAELNSDYCKISSKQFEAVVYMYYCEIAVDAM